MRPNMAARPPNKYGTGECHGECGCAAMGDLAAALKGSPEVIEGIERDLVSRRGRRGGCREKGGGLRSGR